MAKGKKEVTIILDGKSIKCREGENLLKVAQANEVFIPALCYFDHVDPPLGTCRVCTVKVKGKYTAGCQVNAKEGLEVEVMTPELLDHRKAVVEMLFTEGNHICPLCEKSGKCVLQALGYEMGMETPRFPYTFPNRVIDYKPKHIIMENHRCIQCKRCVEDVFTDEGKPVFYFQQRGKETFVAVDYEQEAKLSYEQAHRAMEICPVGTILLKEDTVETPGFRKYDKVPISEKLPEKEAKHQQEISPAEVKKKVVATVSLAGCFGCHMSMLDMDLNLLDLIEVVSFNRSPFTDIKEFTQRCDVGLIEGGCCSDENVEVLRKFRESCDILVSVGACAINGNLPALRNWMPLEQTLREAYLETPTIDTTALIPHHEDLPKILDKVYPCHEVVKIDYFIPGCPPGGDHIYKVVQNLLFGTDFKVPYEEFKYD
ncbi:2Fe-2S iron-sulfur cluster-binding protein [Pontibacter anaerobius]|uniref:2Fe-2S iron-sulfur cluster-binding protein n=1 Tax=Pontibacter anaerobius TaxID=2993940 RepID=A0ABT3RD04_9BACT|nr:2Fe-2S iron-sulfur cluster-binding protein [Pontibacter anaerobius]MCX2739727.1 2Fe-2S iron-sulfur cluster-binding protein [Pontibacter anaerobius]